MINFQHGVIKKIVKHLQKGRLGNAQGFDERGKGMNWKTIKITSSIFLFVLYQFSIWSLYLKLIRGAMKIYGLTSYWDYFLNVPPSTHIMIFFYFLFWSAVPVIVWLCLKYS
jgi:hypothetical protein